MAITRSTSECNWLSSAAEATIYGTSTWKEIQERVCEELSSYVRSRQAEGAQVMQVLMLLTGERFSRRYLADVQSRRDLLYEPFMKDEDRIKLCGRLESELKDWSAQRSPLLITSSFTKEVENIVANAALEGSTELSSARNARRSDELEPKQSFPESITAHSEKLAEGLLSLYERRPELGYDISGMIGLKLCPTLRAFVWGQRLSQSGLKQRILVSIGETLVARNWASVNSSPLKPLIERILITVANDRDFISARFWESVKDRMSTCLDVLNRYHLYTGNYGARYCALLLILIQAFSNLNDADEILFRFTVFTNQSSLQAGTEYADSVIRKLGKLDAELYAHTAGLSQISLLNTNQNRGAKGLPISLNLAGAIGKWLDYGFVGFLQPNALLYVWDQYMLIGWDTIMADICLVILKLVRSQILKAFTMEEVDNVIVTEPINLKVNQIREYFLILMESTKTGQ